MTALVCFLLAALNFWFVWLGLAGFNEVWPLNLVAGIVMLVLGIQDLEL